MQSQTRQDKSHSPAGTEPSSVKNTKGNKKRKKETEVVEGNRKHNQKGNA